LEIDSVEYKAKFRYPLEMGILDPHFVVNFNPSIFFAQIFYFFFIYFAIAGYPMTFCVVFSSKG